MRKILNAALCVICWITALLAQGQTIYKCPDANGRIALQDLPCVGGEQRQIKPASGSDQKATAPVSKPSATAPKNDLDRLRENVGKDAAARKFKDADYDLGVFNQRINNFPTYRAQTHRERSKFYNCGTNKYPIMCEDLDHRRAVDAELEVELNRMRDMRSNANAVKRAANKEHFALTQKWLEE